MQFKPKKLRMHGTSSSQGSAQRLSQQQLRECVKIEGEYFVHSTVNGLLISFNVHQKQFGESTG
jgi:hypothetical protein